MFHNGPQESNTPGSEADRAPDTNIVTKQDRNDGVVVTNAGCIVHSGSMFHVFFTKEHKYNDFPSGKKNT
jgi:hypothetical protein